MFYGHHKTCNLEKKTEQMNFNANVQGYYGNFGGAFIPEMLYPSVKELQEKYMQIIEDKNFQEEMLSLLKDYVGRPTPLFFAERMSEKAGAKIFLKR